MAEAMALTIFGILNITADSFSDGGRYLKAGAALAHGRSLIAGGADVLDIGAASSNPKAVAVGARTEIARLKKVVPTLMAEGAAVSIDSFEPDVQRWALGQGVQWLNDIHGFPDESLYPEMADSDCGLIVMHAVQAEGIATEVDVPPDEIMQRMFDFFDKRVGALQAAGIDKSRIVLDPGMGFFLGTNPETSIEALRRLPDLGPRYDLPVLVSVSRKSFIRALAGVSAADAGAATLAAEIFAVSRGASMIRTHDPKALSDGLSVISALSGA